MGLDSYLVFVVIATGYIASPGPAVFIAINGGATIGIKNTSAILLGNTLGLGLIALISALGLGAFILSSYILTNIVKVAGACWLAYIGIKMMKSKSCNNTINSNAKIFNNKESNVVHFKDGLILALTNPKPIIFFMSIYPQFIVKDGQESKQLILLGIIFMILSFSVLNAYSFISKNTVGKVLSTSRIQLFNFAFGLLFIYFAAFLIIPVLINA